MKFVSAQFSWNQCKHLQNNKYFIHSQISQSERLLKSYHEKLTAHYTCRNADLNFILVLAMTNGLTFQIINSLMKSWRGVCLTCLDCKTQSATELLWVKVAVWLVEPESNGWPPPDGHNGCKNVGTFPVILVN